MIEYPEWALAVARPGDRLADDELAARAVALSEASASNGGGPFGALVADADGRVVALGWNRVEEANDPTAHAELLAIRYAAAATGTWCLRDLRLATSCAPCVMCTGAIHWAGLSTVIVAARTQDAEAVGFVEGPPGFDVAAFLGARGITLRPDVCREAAVAVLRDYTGAVYNG